MTQFLSVTMAQVPDPSGVSGWIDLAERIGIGATVVLGFGYWLLWKEKSIQAKDWKDLLVAKDAQLAAEVAYSKDRDKQTLTLLGELTTLIKTIDKRDSDGIDLAKAESQAFLTAIGNVAQTVTAVQSLIRDHVIPRLPSQHSHQNAA